MFDVGLFRTTFPEFADTVKYPDQMITPYGAVAVAMVNPCRWKPLNMLLLGQQLYVAHEITLEAQNIRTSRVGGAPGTTQGGVATAKTVGNATVNYDAQTTTEEGAGYWNLTTYGKRFYRYTQIFGAGVIQLNGARIFRGFQ